MAQMKWMMYLMPVMFLGFFNNYAAGLSYYYFLICNLSLKCRCMTKNGVQDFISIFGAAASK